MIIQAILDGFFMAFDIIFNMIDFSDLNTATENLVSEQVVLPEMLHYVAYFLDKETIQFLIKLEFIWIDFKIVWAIVLRIKSFIPTISST